MRLKTVMISAILLLLAALCVCRLLINGFVPLKYEDSIEKYSVEYGLDKYLVMAVIRAESGFDSKAHSGLARGLMQLTADTAKQLAGELGLDYDEDMVDDPDTNIRMGCKYLSYLITVYKNRETALAAYNAGMGNVSAWLKNPEYSADGVTLRRIPYGETERYVARVAKFERIYKKLY